MPDDKPQAKVSLTVLREHDKIEQLRRELAEKSSPPPAGPPTGSAAGQSPAAAPAINQTTLIDRAVSSGPSARQKALQEKVIAALQTVYDPEIPVSIYDLGLIYDIEIDDDATAVRLKMTLTAPACPVAGTLPNEVKQRVELIDEVRSAEVELVWDPPWTPARMSEAARLELGLF